MNDIDDLDPTMSDLAEVSTKPYFIRALYEWCTDNGYTPHISVVVDHHARVPQEFVRNGEIVLNISALATNQLAIQNDYVEFQARFGGVAREVYVPIANISAIYARETGHGMAFSVDLSGSQETEPVTPENSTKAPVIGLAETSGSRPQSDEDGPDSPSPSSSPKGNKNKPKLTVIK